MLASAEASFYQAARDYERSGSRRDLMAVSAYWGQLCAYHAGDLPADVETAMDAIKAGIEVDQEERQKDDSNK